MFLKTSIHKNAFAWKEFPKRSTVKTDLNADFNFCLNCNNSHRIYAYKHYGYTLLTLKQEFDKLGNFN